MLRSIRIFFLLSLVPLLGCGASSDAPTAPSHASPQKAYDAFAAAAAKGDWQAMASSLTPESQDMMGVMLMLPAGMMAAFDESAGAEFEQIIAKHGINEDEIDPMMESLPVKDKPAFIADVAAWLAKQGGDTSDMGIPTGTLTDLSVNGDTATAKVDDEPISFKKINGGWYVDLANAGAPSDDVSFSTEPLQGIVAGDAWHVGEVEPGPFGGFTLLSSQADQDASVSSFPEIMLGERWEPMQVGSGELGFSRTITFFVPPGNNIACMSGKYEIKDNGDHWTLLLYAHEDEDFTINGRVSIPKDLGGQQR